VKGQCNRSGRPFHVFFVVCITSHISNSANHTKGTGETDYFISRCFKVWKEKESKIVITLIILETSKILFLRSHVEVIQQMQINSNEYKLIFILKRKYPAVGIYRYCHSYCTTHFSKNSGTQQWHMASSSFSQHLKECFYVKKVVRGSATCWFIKQHKVSQDFIFIAVYLVHNYPFNFFPAAFNVFTDRVCPTIHLQYW